MKMLSKNAAKRQQDTHEVLAEFRNIKPFKEDVIEVDRRRKLAEAERYKTTLDKAGRLDSRADHERQQYFKANPDLVNDEKGAGQAERGSDPAKSPATASKTAASPAPAKHLRPLRRRSRPPLRRRPRSLHVQPPRQRRSSLPVLARSTTGGSTTNGRRLQQPMPQQPVPMHPGYPANPVRIPGVRSAAVSLSDGGLPRRRTVSAAPGTRKPGHYPGGGYPQGYPPQQMPGQMPRVNAPGSTGRLSPAPGRSLRRGSVREPDANADARSAAGCRPPQVPGRPVAPGPQQPQAEQPGRGRRAATVAPTDDGRSARAAAARSAARLPPRNARRLRPRIFP